MSDSKKEEQSLEVKVAVLQTNIDWICETLGEVRDSLACHLSNCAANHVEDRKRIGRLERSTSVLSMRVAILVTGVIGVVTFALTIIGPLVRKKFGL